MNDFYTGMMGDNKNTTYLSLFQLFFFSIISFFRAFWDKRNAPYVHTAHFTVKVCFTLTHFTEVKFPAIVLNLLSPLL